MGNERVDLASLDVVSPDALRSLPLDVGILRNDWRVTRILAQFFEQHTSWRAFPFETYEHAKNVLDGQPLHIFATHWHIGGDHRFNNEVTQLVERLKKKRGTPGVGRGPLLVATCHSLAPRQNPPDSELLSLLETTYDLYLEVPVGILNWVPKIISRLYVMLPVHAQRAPTDAPLL